MKSISKNSSFVNKLGWLAIVVATFFLGSGSMLFAQQELGGSFVQDAPPVHEDSRVAPADFQPMEIPDQETAESESVNSMANDIPAAEDFSVPDDLYSELLEAENADQSFMAGVREQFADLDLARMLGSLAIVLGGYFGIVWLMRKINPSASKGLPLEVVEVMGATPFGPKKHLQVVRLGSKLLLLINSPEGSQLIGEVSDPEEVDYLASLCGGKRRNRTVRPSVARAASRVNPPQPRAATAQQAAPPVADNLRDVLQQLQNVVRTQPNGSVFEA